MIEAGTELAKWFPIVVFMADEAQAEPTLGLHQADVAHPAVRSGEVIQLP